MTTILLMNIAMASSQNVSKTITPVICVKGVDNVVDSGMSAEISGVMKNERFIFSEFKWLKSFKGKIIINNKRYSFDTFFVGRRSYNCFMGNLVWQEYGKEQISAITFNKDLEAFQFVTRDGKLFNGPSADLNDHNKLVSYFLRMK